VIRVGMSGFSYPEWIGEVYPPGTKRDGMLAAYSTIFPCVEINMSFRRTPLEKTIDKWRDAVPESFRFTMKANQRITHWKRLVDVGDDVAIFMKAASGLGSKLGPVLFQVPPTLAFEGSVMDAFGSALVPGFVYAFEYRDASFNTSGAEDAFKRHGIARCLNDYYFEPSTYSITGPFAYFRFHRANYTPSELADRAALLRSIDESGVDVYAFFQHEDDPESVRPALRFLELIA
jgi:uncharacterized protein YecE (DUF72 family)